MKDEDLLNANEKQAVICLSCMSPNDEADAVCQNCGAPLRQGSSLDPIQIISNEGELFRKTVSSRPKFIVLLGAWIFFVAWIITVIAVESQIIANWDGLFSLVLFWCGVALFLFAVYVLFNVTRNYINARETFEIKESREHQLAENRLRAKERRRARMKSKSD